MAHTSECGKGHVYDSDLYATCPYCSDSSTSIEFGGKAASRGIPKTGPVGGYSFTSDVPASTLRPDSAPEVPTGIKKTSPIQQTVGPDGIKRTTVISPVGGAKELVAGWLVCVEGRNLGKDYRLYARNNTVGMSNKNDVVIPDDPTISNEKQLIISYDPRGNEFTAWSADGKNNNYLNNKALYTATPLKAYDLLEVGQTKLIFIPFCSEAFQWKDCTDK